MKTLRYLALALMAIPASANAYTLATPSCSINTDGWCFGGTYLNGFRNAIANPANFGAGGTVGTPVTVSQLGTVTAATLAGSNGFISTWWNDAQAAPYQQAVIDFFLGGGDLLIYQDDTGHDSIGAALGLAAFASDGSASNGTSPLFTGPFGTATNVRQDGYTGRLDAAAVTAKNGTVGSTNAAGQITSAYWDAGQYAAGAGKLVIVGDVDMVSNAYVNHWSPVDNNGRFGLNTINYLIGASAVPEPATWAMMIVGFGAVGAGMRRRRVKVSFA